MKTIWLIPAAVVISAGCSEVSTPYPVGIPVTQEQAEAFNGTWQHEEGLFHLRHAGDGRMILAQLEWDADEGRFELMQDTLVLGRIGQAIVLNFPKDDNPGRYEFVLVQLAEENHLLVWLATVQAYADAVGAGKIEGTIEPISGKASDVRITTEKAAFDAFLAEQPWCAMFDLEKPIVFRRVLDLPGVLSMGGLP
jgi:hypothetical protein